MARKHERRAPLTVFSIGHSTRPLPELVAWLVAAGVRTLVDVRTIPRSRHNPQYNIEELRAALPRAGLRYVHMPALGGLRHTHASSPNTGWRNESFRGYADYMQTEAFATALHDLMTLGVDDGPLCVMCAEAVPWRCHRSLIADALTVRGVHVHHIIESPSTRAPSPHHLTPFARVQGTHITYPPEPPELPLQPG